MAILGLLVLAVWLITRFPSQAPKAASAAAQAAPAPAQSQAAAAQPQHWEKPFAKTAPLGTENPAGQADATPQQDTLDSIHDMGQVFGSNGEARLMRLQAFIGTLTAADLPAALSDLQELQKQKPTQSGQELQVRLLRRWAETDIRAAAAWTSQMPEGDTQRETVSSIAGVWARQNFSDASAWAGQLPDGSAKQAAIESVAREALSTSPKEALKLASTLPATAQRDELIAQASEVWASSTPEEALAWARQVPAGPLHDQVISSIAFTWADRDVASAAKLALSSLPPGKVQNDTVMAIAQRWMQQDSAAAQQWIAQFPEGDLRNAAMAELARTAERNSRSGQAR